MNVPSLGISDKAALELIALVQDGAMTVETYTELLRLVVSHSSLSARTTPVYNWPDGSASYGPRLTTQEELLGYSSTRNGALQMQQSNTPHSHLGCWCNSSKKRDTSNG